MNFKQSFYINLKLRDCLIHNSNLLIFCDGQASKQASKHRNILLDLLSPSIRSISGLKSSTMVLSTILFVTIKNDFTTKHNLISC